LGEGITTSNRRDRTHASGPLVRTSRQTAALPTVAAKPELATAPI
jgi:hypothetical protein